MDQSPETNTGSPEDASEFDADRGSFVIVSERVVTPAGEISAAIWIEHGIIREVIAKTEVPSGLTVIDVGTAIISPGLIDAHVHINEPGRTEWEGFASATAAAAAGGVTTLLDMPLNSSPVTTDSEALEAKRAAAAGQCRVDVGCYGGVVPGKLNELPKLLGAGVFGLKAFLCDSGLDEFPAAGERELRDALALLSESKIPLLVHAELVHAELVDAEPVDATDYKLPCRLEEVDGQECPSYGTGIETDSKGVVNGRSYAEYVASRPPEFEVNAIEMLIRLCREFQTPIHIVHLATSAVLPLIEAAKNEGLPISVETCPHYLYFSAEQIEDGQTQFKCAPPIRDAVNRDALTAAVTQGLIETIGSDHSPCPAELKCLKTGDFSKAWGGVAGLQLTLPVAWTVGQQFGWTPKMLAERLSARPAEIFGLADRKGKIAPGFDADLVVWDPETTFTVRGNELYHRHPVTPYEGRELIGSVRKTFLRGRLIFDADRAANPLVGQPAGELLVRGSPFMIAKCLNEMPENQRRSVLETCCGSSLWGQRMFDGGPFSNDPEVFARSAFVWQQAQESDLLEAFAAHPQIGDLESLQKKWTSTKQLAGREQAGVDTADATVLARLADGNREYLRKFGFIFIVCAKGKSADEMLALLEHRLPNDRATELALAAAEQLKITHLRLRKLVS